MEDSSNCGLRLMGSGDGTYMEVAQNHQQWRTHYSQFLPVFAVYFYAMVTFHLHACPVRLHCLLVDMCEETRNEYFYFT